MGTGAITEYIDVAQVALYIFWLFFAGLIIYLLRENKREGYPLVAEDRRNSRVVVQGYPEIPAPKVFLNRDNTTYQAPPGNIDNRPIAAVPAAKFPGAPLVPTGNPMIDGIGTASYALRQDVPDLTAEDQPRIVPIRVADDHHVDPRDPNPIGMPVYGADKKLAGTVTDLWIDRSEPGVRYLEVALEGGGGRTVLLPIGFAVVSREKGSVRTGAILAHQFDTVPALRNPDLITKLEEDKITGYFAGGYLYATPHRSEPLI